MSFYDGKAGIIYLGFFSYTSNYSLACLHVTDPHSCKALSIRESTMPYAKRGLACETNLTTVA